MISKHLNLPFVVLVHGVVNEKSVLLNGWAIAGDICPGCTPGSALNGLNLTQEISMT